MKDYCEENIDPLICRLGLILEELYALQNTFELLEMKYGTI